MTDVPTFHHLLWPVPDLDAAVEFYVTHLGMTLGFRDGDRYAGVTGGGVSLALVAGSEDVTHGVPAPAYRVVDLGTAVNTAEAAGAEVIVRSQDGPHEVRAVVRDVSGHVVVLYQRR
jgi:catechol 2,3-dioxygenase-like lactoylglutathione lyase family enzyme